MLKNMFLTEAYLRTAWPDCSQTLPSWSGGLWSNLENFHTNILPDLRLMTISKLKKIDPLHWFYSLNLATATPKQRLQRSLRSHAGVNRLLITCSMSTLEHNLHYWLLPKVISRFSFFFLNMCFHPIISVIFTKHAQTAGRPCWCSRISETTEPNPT